DDLAGVALVALPLHGEEGGGDAVVGGGEEVPQLGGLLPAGGAADVGRAVDEELALLLDGGQRAAEHVRQLRAGGFVVGDDDVGFAVEGGGDPLAQREV